MAFTDFSPPGLGGERAVNLGVLLEKDKRGS
jgi:hypothetical protein